MPPPHLGQNERGRLPKPRNRGQDASRWLAAVGVPGFEPLAGIFGQVPAKPHLLDAVCRHRSDPEVVADGPGLQDRQYGATELLHGQIGVVVRRHATSPGRGAAG